MKRFYFIAGAFILFAAIIGIAVRYNAVASEDKAVNAPLISQTIVISQVYGGGGASTGSPTYVSDYVELKNISSSAQSLSGLSLMYGSNTGQFASFAGNVFALPSVTLQPGQFFVVTMAAGTAGGAIPVTPDATATLAMNGTDGKVALVNGLTAGSCGATASPCTLPNPLIVDLVSFGNANNAEGGAAVPALSTTKMAVRKNGGCTDTDNNLNDFDVVTAATPRNTSSSYTACAANTNLLASMGANPTTISPGAAMLVTVNVIPGSSPTSTGITATADFSSVGASSAQTLFDDGTNGDATAGDNIFSYELTVPSGATGGSKIFYSTVTDAQSRTANSSVTVTVNVASSDDDPLALGNPSGATADVLNENNYLMVKPQYTLSYNRGKATANWVAWKVSTYWLGSASRQDDFRPDTTLPSGWYQVTGSDYSGSGYDRGHICPSGDRTRSITDNSATFLMTNMMPQIPANNQQSWAQFEDYTRTLAAAGNEVYVISGPTGNIGTVAGGKVVVPAYTWKVILVLPEGSNDLSRVTRNTRAFGIIVPNQGSLVSAWRTYRVTVDAVEALTGHDFFSLVPKNTQAIIERRRDTL